MKPIVMILGALLAFSCATGEEDSAKPMSSQDCMDLEWEYSWWRCTCDQEFVAQYASWLDCTLEYGSELQEEFECSGDPEYPKGVDEEDLDDCIDDLFEASETCEDTDIPESCEDLLED